MVCSREGFKETKNTGPSVSDAPTKARRRRPSTRVGCMARIVFKRDSAGMYVVMTFEEEHTHCLYEESYKPFLKVNRKLDVGHQQFITNCSKVNVGASKSFDIYAEMVGGVENVGCTVSCVPFTGVDNHKKCMTFAAALIAREDVDLYCWALRNFKSAMGSTPRITVTDQDPAMKVAIAKEFPETRHRYCMWHIMTKVSDKVSPEMARNEEFRRELNGVVWNDSATSENFEVAWKGVIEKYGLQENAWLKRMYDEHATWVPACFEDVFMGGLLRTTSRSEAENRIFRTNTNKHMCLSEFFIRCLGLAQGDSSKLEPIRKTLEEFEATWCESGVERGGTDKGKRVIMESYCGAPQPKAVNVHPPPVSSNKGSGKRIRTAKEIAMKEQSKKKRTCKTCGLATGHNSRSCPQK
ncbi:PREDICTED: protein FAR1-RELATED SEQUENCE 2-like [Ipomoea nil]|uniref:protein FAR1-RELATED SEQUENCE 2-like n=1 Tax=Ipomoea nil TaxID=35883 RepID=UPI0009017EF5|nr:PREDICTED: protein FAR1-RELATED SEQUENCE 2-like [Ipomoea nil]